MKSISKYSLVVCASVSFLACAVSSVIAGSPEVRSVSSASTPRSEAQWILGSVPINDGNLQLLLKDANLNQGFGPVVPNGTNYVANGSAIRRMVNIGSAFGRSGVGDVYQNGRFQMKMKVSRYVAPLAPNRLDPRVTGILYCTRDLSSGVYNYRVVIRRDNDPQYIDEYGIFGGKCTRTEHKHFDCSFDQGWKTVLKAENRAAYDRIVAAMRGTSSLSSQAAGWMNASSDLTTKTAAGIKASSKSLADRAKEIFADIKTAIEAVKTVVKFFEDYGPTIIAWIVKVWGWISSLF